jgi:hypothetical protein
LIGDGHGAEILGSGIDGLVVVGRVHEQHTGGEGHGESADGDASPAAGAVGGQGKHFAIEGAREEVAHQFEVQAVGFVQRVHASTASIKRPARGRWFSS